MIPVALQLAFVFVLGACLGALVNWAIYALAWNPRPVSPWSPPPQGASARTWSDCVPIVGWLNLRREATRFGPRFWLRPMFLEIGLGGALAALYWWEVVRLGLIQEQAPLPLAAPLGPLLFQFAAHAILLGLMAATSFIDIDEKIVPDDITVPGTLLGLLLATLAPMVLLPDVAERFAAPAVGARLHAVNGLPAVGPDGGSLWWEPVTAVSPSAWPPEWGRPRRASSLAVGLGCYGLWCFALAPRFWRGRRGAAFALKLIAARVLREFRRPPLLWLLVGGMIWILCVWWWGKAAWAGLLTSLVGLVGSGGIVWAVRLVGSAALRREAMGFGDVTLMMMVGTFLGWQACLVTFFLAPFAALVVGVLQLLLKHDDVIPYVPYLCLGACGTVACWAPIWNWAQPLFGLGWLVPAMLAVCLAMLGILLAIWGAVKRALFGFSE